MIHLVEISGLPPGSDTLQTLRYCTGEAYVTTPSDAPPNTKYLPRVISPGTYERHLWRAGTTRGRGEVSYGSIELANADGALDFLASWDVDGRALTILRGDPAAGRAAFQTVFAGTMDSIAATWATISVRIRDVAAAVAEKLAVSDRYTGGNVLPNGVEGVADDLKSKSKPLLIGECQNFAPPRVNASLLIYQISAAPIDAITAVFDNGNTLTPGVARANVAALQATAPAVGKYDWSLGDTTEGAYFRLGSTPGSDAITCSARAAPAAGCTVAQTVQTVLARAGATVSGVAALDALQPAVVGYFVGVGGDTLGATDAELVTAGTQIGVVLDALCASVGASWTPDRNGQFVLRRLEPPTGPPIVTFGHWQIIDALTLIPTEDDGRGIPAYEIELHYGRNWTVQSGASVSGAADARKDWLALAYRTARATIPTVWNPATQTGRNPSSKPCTVETLLRDEADAISEATRLAPIYGARRTYLSFVVAPDQAAGVDLGSIIALDTPRFGLAGKPLVVTGILEDRGGNRTTLFAWG
jgi:hypothetical protein